MPFNNTGDLPERIQNVLPDHAQHVYLKAFNSAWDEYGSGLRRRGDESPETVAHKVAWSAVKKSYHKDAKGNWRRDHH